MADGAFNNYRSWLTQDPRKEYLNMHSKNRLAFTLMELLVVMATVAVLVVVLLPAHAATRADVARIQCLNNLKRVGIAFRLWADAHQDRYPMAVPDTEGGAAGAIPSITAGGSACPAMWRVFQVLSNELNTPRVLICPADERTARTNFRSTGSGADFNNDAAVSYFLGRDASETNPRMFLSGDRNIYGKTTTPMSNNGYGNSPSASTTASQGWGLPLSTNIPIATPLVVGWTMKMHQAQGNVALGDGSVQQFTTARLCDQLRQTGDTTTSPGANTILFL